MKLAGKDVDEAIREWAKTELKEGTARTYDLGKFFFSVSSGTTGLIVAIQKLGGLNQYVHKKTLIAALGLLAASICIALDMVRPRVQNENVDLHDAYTGEIKQFIRRTWVWFIAWGLGSVLGVISAVF